MMKNCLCAPTKVAQLLVVVGGLNWGLYGVGMLAGMNLNLVNLALGAWPMVEAIVYVVVGVATVAALMGCKCDKCKSCCAGAVEAPKA